MKKEQILLIVGVFVVVVAAFAFIANEGLFTARVAPTGGRNVNPDYTLPYSLYDDDTLLSSSFANNGDPFYSTRKVDNSFEVLAYAADAGSVLWSRIHPLPGDVSQADVVVARGARNGDVYVVLHTERLISNPSTRRTVLSKYSSASNGIPDWTKVFEPPDGALLTAGAESYLFISDDGSKIGASFGVTSSGINSRIRIYNFQGTLLNDFGLPLFSLSTGYISADGSTLAFLVTGPDRLAVYYLNSATPTTPVMSVLPESSNGVTVISISKDGSYIGFWRMALNIYVVPVAGHNKIWILKKQPSGVYSPIFLDDIGVQDYQIPGTEQLPYAARWYSPYYSFIHSSSFNDADELMIGTTYYKEDGVYAGTKNNIFSYRKTSSTTFERISRYSLIFPPIPYNQSNILFSGIIPLSGSDFLVSFVHSPLPGSPEAFILNPYEGVPKKIFNFPISESYSINDLTRMYRGRAGASLDGSLIFYTYEGAPGSQPASWVTSTNMIHSSMIPLNFTATDGLFLERVRLTWSSVSGATGYDVFRGTVNDVFSAVQLNASPVVSLSYEDSSGAPDQVYYYWVRARAGSNVFIFSTSDLGYRAVAPPAPSGLTASQNFNDRVVLSWGYPTSSTYGYDFFPHATFDVYRSNTQTVPTTGTPYASTISARTFTDLNPFPIGSRGYYKVVAVNAAGSAASGVVMGRVVATRASEQSICFPGDVLNADATCSRTVVGATKVIDGYLRKSGTSWPVVRDAVQSDSFDSFSTSMYVFSQKTSASSFEGDRSVLSFSLSGMTGVTVVSARLTVTGRVNNDFPAGTGSVSLMPWSLGTSLGNLDYGRISLTSASRLAPSVPFSSITVNSSIVFPFDSVGTAYVNNSLSSGKVSFGLVESHHLDNNPYVYPDAITMHQLFVNTTENTSYAKPTLTITYRR